MSSLTKTISILLLLDFVVCPARFSAVFPSSFETTAPKIVLCSEFTNQYIRSPSSTSSECKTDRTGIGGHEQFTPTAEGEWVKFKTAHNTYLYMKENNSRLKHSSSANQVQHFFKIEKVSDTQIKLLAYNGHYLWVNSTGRIKCDGNQDSEEQTIFRNRR